jgi:hypothetical protein
MPPPACPTVLLTVKCPYTRPIVERCMTALGWKVYLEDADVWPGTRPSLHWGEYEGGADPPRPHPADINWEDVVLGDLSASYFCVRKGLIRKAQLAMNLHKFKSKRPRSILHRSVPETWPLDVHDPFYIEEALYDVPEVQHLTPAHGELWVLKPSVTNQARAIVVFNNVQSVIVSAAESTPPLSPRQDMVNEEPEIREWVIQRYVDPPLLIDGCNPPPLSKPPRSRKFHVRAYLVGVGSLKVYLYTRVPPPPPHNDPSDAGAVFHPQIRRRRPVRHNSPFNKHLPSGHPPRLRRARRRRGAVGA